MLGLDNDKPGSEDKMYDFICRTKIELPVINIFMPVPGTVLFEKLHHANRMLLDDYNDFLKKNPLYSVPCHIPFFLPKYYTPEELTACYLKLVKKLYTIPAIIKRSVKMKPGETAKLLLMNFELRKKYMLMNN